MSVGLGAMRVRYRFVGPGSSAPADLPAAELYLDVGDRLCAGVVDHHHLTAYSGSTTALVLRHPELVLAVADQQQASAPPLTIVLHEWPDLDCVASAFLATELLRSGSFPDGARWLSNYVDRVDDGSIGATQENPFSLYTAFGLRVGRLSRRQWRDRAELWSRAVEEGLEIVEHVLGASIAEHVPVAQVDAFRAAGTFTERDRTEIDDDLARYRMKLDDPACRARTARLALPGVLGGSHTVDGLLVRDVQSVDDPQRVMFFKDWARTDAERAPAKRGFVALSVYTSATDTTPSRCILSVRPEAGVTLEGLAARLDALETAERERAHGVDDRVVDPRSGASLTPRIGYANADPWYDGRAHAFTIVDSPRSGTMLSADAIESTLLEFGADADAGRSGPRVLAVENRPPGDEPRDAALQQLTTIAVAAGRAPAEIPDVVISYPHRQTERVRRSIYEPLIARLDPRAVFLDTESLRGGIAWLQRLATVIDGCRVFLPTYCEDYFRSDFCQWELQLAILRDPVGARGVLLPVLLEPVVLPRYCSLVQAEDASRPGFEPRLLALLTERLGDGATIDRQTGEPDDPGDERAQGRAAGVAEDE